MLHLENEDSWYKKIPIHYNTSCTNNTNFTRHYHSVSLGSRYSFCSSDTFANTPCTTKGMCRLVPLESSMLRMAFIHWLTFGTFCSAKSSSVSRVLLLVMLLQMNPYQSQLTWKGGAHNHMQAFVECFLQMPS